MPSLSRTYYEAQSIEEVFLRRQMQHIAVALDKSPLLQGAHPRRPTTSDGRLGGGGDAGLDSTLRSRTVSPLAGGLSMHTLRAIATAGGTGTRPLAQLTPGRTGTWQAERTLEWPASDALSAHAAPAADARQPSVASMLLPPLAGQPSLQQQLGAPGASGAAEERAARDAATIAELRATVDDLRARLDGLEGLLRSVNLEFTLNTQRRLQDSFMSITNKLEKLDEHLLTEGQKAEVRAATLLTAAARGFVARARYRRASGALGAWRKRALQSTSNQLIAWLIRNRRIKQRLDAINRASARTMLLTVTAAWRAYTRGNVPARGELAEMMRARRHNDWRLARATLLGWQRVVRQARIAGVRYVVRANRRVAMREAEAARLQLHLAAWRQVTTALLQVERKFGAVMRSMAAKTLHALRAWVSRARGLRLISLERWLELMKRRSELPFRAWFLHTVDRKIVRRSQEALVRAFTARAARLLAGRIVRAWFELAVHKRVEVRSRSQLIRALQEQEEAARLLEENIAE